MGTVQIGIFANHFRLKPQAKFHPFGVHMVNHRAQAAFHFFLIDDPIAQPGAVAVAIAKPAIVQHKCVNSGSLHRIDDVHQFLIVKIKICAFPIVNQQRARRMRKTMINQMIAERIVERPAHAADPLRRIGDYHFRRLKCCIRSQLPRKIEVLNTAADHRGAVGHALRF